MSILNRKSLYSSINHKGVKKIEKREDAARQLTENSVHPPYFAARIVTVAPIGIAVNIVPIKTEKLSKFTRDPISKVNPGIRISLMKQKYRTVLSKKLLRFARDIIIPIKIIDSGNVQLPSFFIGTSTNSGILICRIIINKPISTATIHG